MHCVRCTPTHAVCPGFGNEPGLLSFAAGSLRQQRLIRCSRGDITVLDRRGLEASACSCYGANQDTYARIMN